MPELTGNEVWDAALKDPDFLPILTCEKRQKILKPFIEASVSIFANRMETKVSLQTIAEARIAFLKHCYKEGLAHEIAQVLEETATTFHHKLKQLIEYLEETLKDVSRLLIQHNVTEETALMSALSENNGVKLLNNVLTFKQLLKTQPALVCWHGH